MLLEETDMQAVQQGLIEQIIALICKAVLWVSTLTIFVILVGNTYLRYTQGSSLQWGSEVPELLFPWLVMSGVVLASLHGNHIATTFLLESLPAPTRRLVGIVIWLLVAGMYASISWATYELLDIVKDEKTPILRLPGSITYICMMSGMVMMGLLALQSAWRIFQRSEVFPQMPPADSNESVAQG